jgi:hypothetical protein
LDIVAYKERRKENPMSDLLVFAILAAAGAALLAMMGAIIEHFEKR